MSDGVSGTSREISSGFFSRSMDSVSANRRHATIIRVATDTVSESRERRRPDYRNPTVAEVMRHLDFVQRFGVGITLARQELAANGNPPPEFLVSTTNVLAVLRKAAQDAWAEYRQLALKIVRPLALPE